MARQTFPGSAWIPALLVALFTAGEGLADSLHMSQSSPTDVDPITFSGTYENPGWHFDGIDVTTVASDIYIIVRQTGNIGTLSTQDPFSVVIDPLAAGGYRAHLQKRVRLSADLPYSAPGDRTNPIDFTVSLSRTGQVVAYEFFHADLGHYFMSSDDTEARMLRDHPELGWMPTGGRFNVYDRNAPNATIHPVCRFYGSVNPGPNSHFYTAFDNECAGLRTLQATTPAAQPRWNYEGIAFSIGLPATGRCDTIGLTKVVYRVYNGRGPLNDSNHRYVTDETTYRSMIGQGWIGEGVVMCAPD